MKDKLLKMFAGVSTVGDAAPEIKIEPSEVIYMHICKGTKRDIINRIKIKEGDQMNMSTEVVSEEHI